jgi:hypothetical protein
LYLQAIDEDEPEAMRSIEHMARNDRTLRTWIDKTRRRWGL